MRWVAIIAYLLLLVATVHAQNFLEGVPPIGAPPIAAPSPFGNATGLPIGAYPTVVTNPGPPPVCNNSLDLTQSCNSQYLGVVVF
jgi:hypothetical protein